ncbi:hypothetical protein ACFYZI_22630 [Streptomyces griseorubiginosus]|uniref:hypothetical protein n=1 Tax=Streptomyces griseorubiginosus TaxID=67304 RepID=UPI0036B30A2F
MISTRRIVAAIGLAVGVTGLAAPLANAAGAAAQDASPLSPMATLDSLAVSEIPAEHRAQLPKVSEQLNRANDLYRLNELHQVTDLAAPVTGLVPAIET